MKELRLERVQPALRQDTPAQEGMEIQELSVEHASVLLFLSFRFSQGAASTQSQIFHWLHLNFPQYRFRDEAFVAEVLKRIQEMSQTFILKNKTHKEIDLSKVNTNAKDELYAMRRVLDGELGDEQQRILVLQQLVNGILERDFKYIEGRPAGQAAKSHIVTYAFNHRPTGAPEYDQMFREIGDFINQEKNKIAIGELSLLGPITRNLLKSIEEAYSVKKND